jgi:starch phosphorylase
MKFMLNGAVTLGTEDGANVEIHELVGDENIYVFGEDSDTVIQRYDRGDYHARDYYEGNKDLKKAVNFIISKKMLKIGSRKHLLNLYNELICKDWFMTFPDFNDYVAAKERAYADYEDSRRWAQKMLVNIAKAGFFSSDRTIAQYDEDIWHL